MRSIFHKENHTWTYLELLKKKSKQASKQIKDKNNLKVTRWKKKSILHLNGNNLTYVDFFVETMEAKKSGMI
jgi:hypothetical protein